MYLDPRKELSDEWVNWSRIEGKNIDYWIFILMLFFPLIIFNLFTSGVGTVQDNAKSTMWTKVHLVVQNFMAETYLELLD